VITRGLRTRTLTIRTSDGSVAARNVASAAIANSGQVVQTLRLPNPRRWDIQNPYRYTLCSTLRFHGVVRDAVETKFGVRTVAFTPDDGFHLNGRRVQLRGVNLHHDQGVLGARTLPRAMERQLDILKDMGCNAIRTSHNTPAPELAEFCDQKGLLVYAEVFDKWGKAAGYPAQPTEFVQTHAEAEIRNAVLRDRNHPSVVVYSMGNEIGEIEADRWKNSEQLVRLMRDSFRKYDPTRPVTFGCFSPGSLRKNRRIMLPLDATSWNYGRKYLDARDIYPEKGVIYSESASAVSTRGFYELPLPLNKSDYSGGLQVDSYDFNAAWGRNVRDIPDWEFHRMEQDRYVAGEFVWTGFDYLGEPTPYQKTARSSYFGIVDLCGIPKDRYYLYRSHWAPEETTVHILPHWNWPERKGQTVPVFVYTNGDEAELFVNGRSQGRQRKRDRAAALDTSTHNQALNKPARASSQLRVGWWPRTANCANDGSSFFGWTAGSLEMPQWWQVDLGKMTAIAQCRIHWEAQADLYTCDLLTSDDGTRWHKAAGQQDFTNQGDQAVATLNANTRFLKVHITRVKGVAGDEQQPGNPRNRGRDSREWAEGSPDPRFAGIREIDLRAPGDEEKENPYYRVVDYYRLRWMDVPCEPGELKVVAYKQNRKIGERVVKTAGPPAALRLTPDRNRIHADGDDLSYVLVEMVDRDGVPCPRADHHVAFSVRGPAEIAGIGNGNPMEFDCLADARHPLFFGKAMLVLRSRRGLSGMVTITAKCDGITAATATVTTE